MNDLIDIDEAEFRDIEGSSSTQSAQSKGLDDWMSELGTDSNAEIRVYQDPGGGNSKKTFLFAFEPNDFDYVQLCIKLRDEFGGGNFRIQAWADNDNPNSRNGRKLVFNKTLSVTKPAPTLSPQNNSSEMVGVLETIIAMQERQEQRMEALINGFQNQVPTRSPMDYVEMASAAMPIVLGLKNLFGPSVGGVAVDPFESAGKVIGLMKDLNIDGGERNNADVLLEAVKSLGQPIMKLVSEQNAPPNQVHSEEQSGETRPVAPTIKQNPAARQTPPNKEVNTLQVRILKDLNMMVKAARRGSDPGLYADLLIDQYEEDELRQVVTNPKLLDMAQTMVRGMSEYRPWFDEVLSFVGDALNGEANDEGLETVSPDVQVISVEVDTDDSTVGVEELTGDLKTDITADNETSTNNASGNATQGVTPDKG